jgi:hypothetical protein
LKHIWNKKHNKEKKRRKEKKKQKEENKEKKQREIMKNYFLPQRTGLEICHLKWPANVSTMMFSPRACATLFKMTFIN